MRDKVANATNGTRELSVRAEDLRLWVSQRVGADRSGASPQLVKISRKHATLNVDTRIAGSALSEPTPAAPSERRAASESSRRANAADLVVRAPVVLSTHVRAAVCAAVRRVTSPRLLLSSSHRRLNQNDSFISVLNIVSPVAKRNSWRGAAGSCARAQY